MTNEQERERVAQILAKQERGDKLTDKKWTILAYSPTGQAAGALRAPQASSADNR
jgi:hypothetical protein